MSIWYELSLYEHPLVARNMSLQYVFLANDRILYKYALYSCNPDYKIAIKLSSCNMLVSHKIFTWQKTAALNGEPYKFRVFSPIAWD